jgi:hypothetical protein
MGKVDTTLFTKKLGNDLFVLQIYVDDIIFGRPIRTITEKLAYLLALMFGCNIAIF